MSNNKLANLIAYWAFTLGEQGAEFGKTKLVKLIYLSDVEYYRRYGTTISGISWIFYHFGPYSPAIDDALPYLHLDIAEEQVTTARGFKAKIIRVPEYLYDEAEKALDASEKRTVNRVREQWGLEELNPLLTHVYFHTEPMKNAKRGDQLDFSTIETVPLSYPPKDTKQAGIPSEDLKNFRERLRLARFSSESQRLSLEPPARFDAVYEEAVRRLNREDSSVLLHGEVQLGDDVKDDLASQQE